MLALGGQATDQPDGLRMARAALADGSGWEWFRKLVMAQGGDVSYIDEPQKLPCASLVESVPAPRSGYLSNLRARAVGEAVVLLGGGRAQKGDRIDHGVGIAVHHKVGDQLEAGQPLFTVYASDADLGRQAKEMLLAAHTWSDEPVQPLPMFYGVVD
jgi:pyrimidine-nucleoside phosphorylase